MRFLMKTAPKARGSGVARGRPGGMRGAAGGLNSLTESDKSCYGDLHHALAPRKRGRRIQSLRAFRLADFYVNVSCFVWCVWLVWWVWLVCCFFWSLLKKNPRGSFFHIFWSCLMDFWSLEVTFSDILVSLGRLSTCLVPRGIQGADVVEIILSRGSLLASFWGHF